jgi:hypothetical protein
MKLEQLRDDTQTAYPSPHVIAEIAKAVVEKLGAKAFKPEAGLADRVQAWKFGPERKRDQQSADGRPSLQISAESQWLRPEQNQQVGNQIVPRQPLLEESWQDGFEWRQASLRMAGHFDRMRQPIYSEPADKSESPVGPNLPQNSKHSISW